MPNRYYIPAGSEEAARAVVSGIEAGRIPCLPEYTDADLAAENFDRYPRGYRAGLRLWCIERRAVDDGRITNVWPVDQVGEAAAATIIFCMIPLIGIASCFEVLA